MFLFLSFNYFHFYMHVNTQTTWHNNEHSHLTILSPHKADGTKIWTFLITVTVTKWWFRLVSKDRNWSSKSKRYSRCSMLLIWLLFSPRIVRIKSSYGTGAWLPRSTTLVSRCLWSGRMSFQRFWTALTALPCPPTAFNGFSYSRPHLSFL